MLIEFKPWHLKMMNLTSKLRALVGDQKSADRIEALSANGLAYTVVGDDARGEAVILGVAGAVPLDMSRVEVFVVSAVESAKYPKEFVSSVQRILDVARERFPIVEARGEDTPFFDRWFTFLGFTKVGPRADWHGDILWRIG